MDGDECDWGDSDEGEAGSGTTRAAAAAPSRGAKVDDEVEEEPAS